MKWPRSGHWLGKNWGVFSIGSLHKLQKREAEHQSEAREHANTLNRQVLRIPLETMIKESGGEIWQEEGHKDTLCFRDQKGEVTRFRLPPDGVLYKGGLPRLLLKLVLKNMPASEALEKAQQWRTHGEGKIAKKLTGNERVSDKNVYNDRTQNDIDVMIILKGDGTQPIPAKLMDQAKALGADPDGVEYIARKNLTDDELMVNVFEGRDGNGNECVLTKDGLVVCDRAVEAMYTGNFEINEANKEFYGIETFFHDKTMLATARGEMRMLKFVSEGKFTSFPWCKLNRLIDPGVYWLVLYDKFKKKPNGMQLLSNLLHLGKEAGLVEENETLKDVLTRAHKDCPFFDVNKRGSMTERKLLIWFAGKVARMASRKAKRALVGGTLDPEREPGDTEIQNIDTHDAPVLTEEKILSMRSEIAAFEEEAGTRTAQYETEHETKGNLFQKAIEERRAAKNKDKKQAENLEKMVEDMRDHCIDLQLRYEEECDNGQGERAMKAREKMTQAIADFAMRTGQLPFQGAERYMQGDDDMPEGIEGVAAAFEDDEDDEAGSGEWDGSSAAGGVEDFEDK
jgi:hypothetical protein